MSSFDVFLIGNNERLSVEIDTENVASLSELLSHQRFLIGRIVTQIGEQDLKAVSIPISRINLILESA